MTSRREDLDAGNAGPEDATAGERPPAVHPGKVLQDDFLGPMGISVHALAKATKLPRSRVNDIVLGRRAVTADTALRLGRYLGTTPEFWQGLQRQFDMDVLKDSTRKRGTKKAEAGPA